MLKKLRNTLTLTAASAGLMYLFDPDMGNRRRARIRDGVEHCLNRTARARDRTLRDLENRVEGLAAQCQRLFAGRRTTDDDTLAHRVHSKLGRYTSHSSAIQVDADNGRVTLSGPILASEVEELIAAIRCVEGVERVENRLDVHSSAEGISALQGGREPGREPLECMQRNWSPSARLIFGTAGGLLMLNCAHRKSISSTTLGVGGLLLFVRSLTNQPLFGSADFNRSHDQPCQSKSTAKEADIPIIERNDSSDELVDEAAMESFPASDPPSFAAR